MSTSFIPHPSSYRDPSGFVFLHEGTLYRQVNNIFREDFVHFIKSGFYDYGVKNKWLIPHEEIKNNLTGSPDWYTTLKPQRIPFTSYPYEWSFDMLKDAALLTLRLAQEAIPYGLVLKDSSPSNIQWHRDRLIFIDTLSFEKYHEENPWIAYRQFCECFLSPLLLMHFSKISLHELSKAWPEGIPLSVTGSLLPYRSRFSLQVWLHIHLHNRLSAKNPSAQNTSIKFSKPKMLRLLSGLESLVKSLQLPAINSAWSGYYQEALTRNDYLQEKTKIISNWLEKLSGIRTAADFGANDGTFSKLLSTGKIFTIAADFDPYCINNLYLDIRKNALENLQPLVLDVSNPSAAGGVNNEERLSFVERAGFDLALALALVHHLAIGKNIPFGRIAGFFHKTANNLIIEFIPREDEKIQLMLQQKRDIYSDYREMNFVRAFEKYFDVADRQMIPRSGRILFLMKRR